MAHTSTPESMHVGQSSIAWLVLPLSLCLALQGPKRNSTLLGHSQTFARKDLTRDSRLLFADTQSPRNASRLHSTVHDEQYSHIGVLQSVLVEVCPKALQGQGSGTPGQSKHGIHCKRGDHHDQCVHEGVISRQ